MSVIRRIPWTIQPPAGTKINWGHPLAKKIAYVKNFRDIYAPDSVGNVSPTVVDHPQTSGYLEATGTAEDYFDSNYTALVSNGVNNGQCSALMVMRTTDTTGSMYSMRDGTDSVVQFFLTTSTRIQQLVGVSASAKTLHTASGDVTDGEWHVVGHSAKIVTSAGEAACFIDGVIGSGGWVATTTAGSTSAINLSVGNRWQVYPATGFTLDGDFRLFLFWLGRKLTADEHAQLAKNPWQIFEPRIVRMPTEVVAAAGAGSIMNQLQGSNLGADLYNGTIL